MLEAIFGRDWQRIVKEKVATREGQQWLNRKVEAWVEEQDRIAAYNYLNGMDSLVLLRTEFPSSSSTEKEDASASHRKDDRLGAERDL